MTHSVRKKSRKLTEQEWTRGQAVEFARGSAPPHLTPAMPSNLLGDTVLLVPLIPEMSPGGTTDVLTLSGADSGAQRRVGSVTEQQKQSRNARLKMQSPTWDAQINLAMYGANGVSS